MILYNVLNDICNDGYDIYVYYQDIEHLYSYLMSINWYCISKRPKYRSIEINVLLNDKYIQIW